MPERPSHPSVAQQVKFDAICIQFEQAWRQDQQPKIELFLEGSAETERPLLLRLLMLLELEYLEQKAPPTNLDDYLARFPREQSLVRRVFAEHINALEQNSMHGAEDVIAEHESHKPMDVDLRQTGGRITEGPGCQIGRYKLLEQIGEGGMGVVYMAEQLRPVRRKVALKIIKPGMDTKQVVARFEAERQALAMMDHANIARVFDAGSTESGRPYFVMELVRGIAITEYCDKNKLEARDRLKLFIFVCQAVQHAHTKGIIHRDLKPTNVLVTLHDGVPVPKIIDFGVAKATGQQLTERTLFTSFAQMVGTPLYMSPEQAEMSGLDVDTRSDIYSLGVVLYELLTGVTPFDRDRLHTAAHDEMRRIIREEDPVKPSSRVSTMGESSVTVSAQRSTSTIKLALLLRGELDWIVMKAMEKDRARRYETASSFVADVTRYLNGEPVEACPPSATYRMRKFAQRYQAQVVVGLSFLLLLVGSSVVAWFLYVDARMARNASELAQADLVVERDRAEKNFQSAKAAKDKAETATGAALRASKDAQWQLYRANIVAATATLKRENSVGARQLLQNCPAEFRNWEWNHLRTQLDMSSQILTGHQDMVHYALFGRDGHKVFSCSADNTVRIWNAINGESIAILRGHIGSVGGIFLNSDGTRLASSSHDNTVRIWDTSTGNLVSVLPAGYSFAAFHPDGKRLATTSHRDGKMRLWDISTGEQIIELPTPAGQMPFLAFSPDGRRLATSTPDSTVTLWDTDTLVQVAVLRGHTGPVEAIAFSADSSRIATGAHHTDFSARLWNTKNGEQINVMEGHRNNIKFVAFSPSGNRIVTASHDSTLRLWDGNTGNFISVLDGHRDLVHKVAFSSNGAYIASASFDYSVRLWDGENGSPVAVLHGHEAGVVGMDFNRGGTRLVSSSVDTTVRIWDIKTLIRRGILRGHESYVYSVAYSPDGSQIASAAWDGTVRLWDAKTGQQTAILQVPMANEQTKRVLCVSFNADGTRIAAALGDCTVHIWEPATQRQFVLGRSGKDVFDSAVVFSPDGDHVVFQQNDGGVCFWNLETSQQTTFTSLIYGSVRGFSFQQEGTLLAMALKQGTVQVWDTQSPRMRCELHGHGESVNSVVFHPDGSRLASASDDETVRVWDLTTGNSIQVLEHPGRAYAAVFSPDGTRLVTGCTDKVVRIWDVRTWDLMAELQAHDDYVHALAFSPDGSQLASGSGDHTVRIWDSISRRKR